MKRILFTMMLMVTVLVTWAQRWNPVSNNSYRDESPVYLQITLNGQTVSPNDALEVAAFIGDECRAYARSFYQPTVQDQLPEDVFLLNVQGDPDNDAGATITFKAYYEGVVYKFTTTATWNGETIQPVPVKLTLDALSGVKLDDEVIIDDSGDAIVNKVEVSLPGTKDMASLVTLVYGADGKAATEVTGSEVDTSETELFLSWDGANAASYFTIDEAGKLEAVSETGENGVWLGMKVMIRDLKNTANGSYLESQAQISSTSFSVVITKANILVSSITCDITELTVHVGDNILTALDEHISIEPDDATDNTYILYDTNGLLNQNYIATKSGKTVVSIEANSPADGVTPAQVNLTVLDYINEITANQQEVTVEVGDNAFDAINSVISWTPSGQYVDEELVFTPKDNSLYDKTGKAIKAGSTAVTVTPKKSPATHLPSVTVTLIVNEKANPVTAIEVGGKAIMVYVGDDVKEAIKNQVTYTPEDADEADKDFTVEETDNVSKGTAIKPGECDVHVYAANDNSIVSTKTVHVTVMALPDYINGPDELTVNVGDNVKDAVEAAITIGSTQWDNDATASQYIDKSFTLSTNTNTAYYDQNYKATRVTENAITITVTTNGKDKTGAPLTKSINLTIKQGVTSLTAETTTINAIIGDDVYSMIQQLITVNPSEATNKNYTLTPNNADAFKNGVATKAGTWTVVAKSEDNPNATLTFTVNVAEPVTLSFDSVLEATVGQEVTLTLTKETGGTVDPSKVTVRFTSNNNMNPVTATPDATGLVWTIKSSMTGTFTFYVSYDGVNQYSSNNTETGTLTVKQKIVANDGWDWITVNSLPTGSGSIVLYSNGKWVPEMQTGKSKVIEIRSQTALLYNDPTYGLFGDITELKPSDGMYKIKTEGGMVFDLGTSVSGISASDLPQTVKGYTWLGYPHQIDQPLSALATSLASTAEEGDMIIGKDNFAEFNGSSWDAVDGFTFKAGKGYMYYTQGSGGKTINWGTPDPSAAKAYESTFFAKSNAPRVKIWEYDNSAFADNMPIVAVLSGIDDPENYSVGAFVGDECRGEGGIAGGKYMFINVGGTAGETVTFKLYNYLDGTYSELTNTLTYGGKAGSLKNPVELIGQTTAIRTISIGDSEAVITITNAAGTVVRSTVGTSISLEGLPRGMYIITTNDGLHRISKKIVK
ncbi:MAG: T9SS type A sorting domain-containing protein [Prevotella sp.]|nr:T9SS type A sorting domain-containing protein [Prevotella sp.]